MTASYALFMALMLGAFVAMVWAWIATIRFFNANKQPEQSQLNPIHGITLWARFLSAGAFGPEAEPGRRRIVRTYLLAGGLFALAVLSFLVLPVVPD